MPPKKKVDSERDVKKFIAEEDRLRAAKSHDRGLANISRVTEWHEGKQKGDFAEDAKRSKSFIREEPGKRKRRRKTSNVTRLLQEDEEDKCCIFRGGRAGVQSKACGSP
ncbi:unnamed protein product [Prorocentrum cordatum]|uniref:Uncharacterized protein n=1 Tax=Prorocentrum cordatum TaxID=2364126 RepID=A0ABN9S1E7_9DINO|nr:unnamed protein product [Polarella glacialis]